MTTTITGTASANVIDGYVRTDPSSIVGAAAEDTDILILPTPTGLVTLYDECGPWAEDELSMDRADAALRDLGWERTGPWSPPYDVVTAPVRVATNEP